MSQPPPLLYADSERSADLLYFGRFSVPDAFLALAVRGRKYAVLSALEFGRGKKTSGFDVILPLETYLQRARERWPGRKTGMAEVIALVATELKQKRFTVPEDFPAGLAAKLPALGVKLTIADGPLFPEREIKSAAEAAAIREGNRCAALGFAAAERLLRASRIRGDRLFSGGAPLTSERLQFAIETACLEAGALSLGTIAAGGDQACDPHGRGHGPRPRQQVAERPFPAT